MNCISYQACAPTHASNACLCVLGPSLAKHIADAKHPQVVLSKKREVYAVITGASAPRGSGGVVLATYECQGCRDVVPNMLQKFSTMLAAVMWSLTGRGPKHP